MTVWTVPAEVIRIVDADTFRLRLSLGWHTYREENCRIFGVNAPEMKTQEGRQAAVWAACQIQSGAAVVFVSHELDKYGRPLGRLLYGTPPIKDYGAALLAAGHGVPYLI